MESENYSEIVLEKYQDIVQSLYDLQNEINDYIDFANEDEDEEEVNELLKEQKLIEKIIECAFNFGV
jgi:tRNA U34 5-carboxymethylaminomethyl modifying GTPase MnmE/TrmE